jgi:TetR/AcrR family transcriptional regulator
VVEVNAVDFSDVKTPSPDLAGRLLEVTEQALRTDPPPRLEDIAQLVGVSRATLYYYFSGRDDLLAFLLTEHAKAGANAVQAATDPVTPPALRLRAMVTAMVDYLGSHPGICAGLLGALGDTGRMREVLQVNDTWILSPLRELLADGQTAGVFALDDAADAANAILGAVLLGVLGRSMSGGDTTQPRFRDQLADQTVRGILA